MKKKSKNKLFLRKQVNFFGERMKDCKSRTDRAPSGLPVPDQLAGRPAFEGTKRRHNRIRSYFSYSTHRKRVFLAASSAKLPWRQAGEWHRLPNTPVVPFASRNACGSDVFIIVLLLASLLIFARNSRLNNRPAAHSASLYLNWNDPDNVTDSHEGCSNLFDCHRLYRR